jgi:hypothetical protein
MGIRKRRGCKSQTRQERREEKRRRNKIKKIKSQKKDDPGAQKGRTAAKHWCFSNDLWLRRVEK